MYIYLGKGKDGFYYFIQAYVYKGVVHLCRTRGGGKGSTVVAKFLLHEFRTVDELKDVLKKFVDDVDKPSVEKKLRELLDQFWRSVEVEAKLVLNAQEKLNDPRKDKVVVSRQRFSQEVTPYLRDIDAQISCLKSFHKCLPILINALYNTILNLLKLIDNVAEKLEHNPDIRNYIAITKSKIVSSLSKDIVKFLKKLSPRYSLGVEPIEPSTSFNELYEKYIKREVSEYQRIVNELCNNFQLLKEKIRELIFGIKPRGEIDKSFEEFVELVTKQLEIDWDKTKLEK